MRLLFLLIFCSAISLKAQIPEVGICSEMEKDSMLFAAGYTSLAESIARCFSPLTLDDTQFAAKLIEMKNLRTRIVACNLFIPGDMKLVGPAVDEKRILDYATVVLRRYQQAGLHLIVWGSGGARRIPDGFDRATAEQQFIAIARKLAVLAEKYDVILALENLNHTETNFITTLTEAHQIVNKVNHPNLRLNADIYHMLKENEPPAAIVDAGKYIVHCELAERERRTPPGTAGDDFTPYLSALKEIHFAGYIMLECRWDNIALQAGPAKRALQAQQQTLNSKR